MRTIKAAELIQDFSLYPRNNVDNHNVRAIQDARLAGEKMPPIVIDQKSKRVVDGIHRLIAELRIDEEATVEVIERRYKNDAEMFLDAMRLNATHGARLDPCDRTHCIILAEKLHIPMDAVAGALHMSVDKLAGLKNTRTATSAGGLSIPLKRTMEHMAGRKLTKPQIEANERSSGMIQVFYVNQIVDLIETKLLNQDDETLLERLRHLHGLLEELLTTA